MAHFEVGKKVIAVRETKSGVIKRGSVWNLLAIKIGCCCPLALQIDFDYIKPFMCKCSACGVKYPKNEGWFDSDLFAPYDDSLSELTTEQILNSETVLNLN